jgi:hypothetical protein
VRRCTSCERNGKQLTPSSFTFCSDDNPLQPEESQRAQGTIEGDRKHCLHGAIVGVMKARKQLVYEQTKMETMGVTTSVSYKRTDLSIRRERHAGAQRGCNLSLYTGIEVIGPHFVPQVC